MERKNKNKEIPNKTKVENKEGLTVSYDKDELKENFPHLINEITGKKKFVKIDSIEKSNDLNQSNIEITNADELENPGAIDFLRRCTNNDEALNILNYLLKRKEISEEDYNSFKYQILEGEGLKKFIDTHGGFKDRGYYEKKYREITRSKLKQDKN
ncbi:MAG: DUF2095 family protein [Candidatus Hodarchaeales archaeon]|jgi:hypothetical protein